MECGLLHSKSWICGKENGVGAPLGNTLLAGDAMKELVATVGNEGQITIPVEVRCHLGIDALDKVVFVLTDQGTVELRPARFTLESVLGSVEALANESDDLDREIVEAKEVAIADQMRRTGRR